MARVVHFEIPYDDGDRARAFYDKAFGWQLMTMPEMGYTLVNWTYGADWNKGTAQELLPGYLKAIRPGAILLFHDGGKERSKSLAMAEAVIQSARQRGFEIVTVGELLKAK